MLRRLLVIVAMSSVAAFAGFASPASAAKPAGGSLTTTLTIAPTTFVVDGYTVTVSGSLLAAVTHFSVDSSGHVVAVATASGSLTATVAGVGTATINIADARLVLNATVQADCSGHLTIQFRGVFQIDATLTFTIGGVTVTIPVNETVPLSGTLTYTATTQQQQSLICDIATLLGNSSSPNALVDKLNTLLKTL